MEDLQGVLSASRKAWRCSFFRRHKLGQYRLRWSAAESQYLQTRNGLIVNVDINQIFLASFPAWISQEKT
jgi:hypothetical protein